METTQATAFSMCQLAMQAAADARETTRQQTEAWRAESTAWKSETAATQALLSQQTAEIEKLRGVVSQMQLDQCRALMMLPTSADIKAAPPEPPPRCAAAATATPTPEDEAAFWAEQQQGARLDALGSVTKRLEGIVERSSDAGLAEEVRQATEAELRRAEVEAAARAEAARLDAEGERAAQAAELAARRHVGLAAAPPPKVAWPGSTSAVQAVREAEAREVIGRAAAPYAQRRRQQAHGAAPQPPARSRAAADAEAEAAFWSEQGVGPRAPVVGAASPAAASAEEVAFWAEESRRGVLGLGLAALGRDPASGLPLDALPRAPPRAPPFKPPSAGLPARSPAAAEAEAEAEAEAKAEAEAGFWAEQGVGPRASAGTAAVAGALEGEARRVAAARVEAEQRAKRQQHEAAAARRAEVEEAAAQRKLEQEQAQRLQAVQEAAERGAREAARRAEEQKAERDRQVAAAVQSRVQAALGEGGLSGGSPLAAVLSPARIAAAGR